MNFKKYSFAIFIALIVVYWGTLFLNGYPEAFADDTVYVGAAIHFAEQGRIWNTLTPGLLENFNIFPYVTFYSWLLGYWLKILGISTIAILAFWGFINLFFSITLTICLRRLKIPYYLIMAAILVYTAGILEMGMRPNFFANALFMGGLLFLSSSQRVWLGFGWMMIGLSITTLSYMVAFAFPLGLAWIYLRYKSTAEEPFCIYKDIATVLTAAVSTLLIYGGSVEFRYLDWLEAYTRVAKLNATPFDATNWKEGWFYAWKSITNGWNLLLFGSGYLLSIVLLGVQIHQWKSTPLRDRLLSIIFFMGLIFAGALYSVFLILIIPTWTLIYVLVISHLNQQVKGTRFNRYAVQGALLAVPLAIVLKVIPFIFQTEYDPQKLAEIKSHIQNHPEKNLVISTDSWRYIFDYRAPAGTVCAEYCVPQEGRSWVAHLRTMKSKNENDLWILSAYYMECMIPDSQQRFTPLKAGGRTFRSIRQYRNEILLIP